MNKARFLPLAAGLAFLLPGCNPKDDSPKSVLIPSQGFSVEAQSAFHQSRYYTDALALDPREPDGMLMVSFSTDPSYVQYKYPALGLDNPTPYLSARTETAPAETDRIGFHLEFPMTVGQTLPAEIRDVQSVVMSGEVLLDLTLSPDFPFTEADVEEATITLPSWLQEEYPIVLEGHRMAWPFSKTIHPGQVNRYAFYCSNVYPLGAGDGILEPEHRLFLDATISIDGILSVNEKNRKDRGEASSPWSATFLSTFTAGICRIWRVTGHLDLSRKMEDRTLVFSELPSFLQDSETVLDLEDVHGELTIRNESTIPVSISGTLFGDDRAYRFNCPPVPTTEYGEAFHGLLSEKGGRVTESMGTWYQDIQVPGLSGLIDGDPVSFAVKDVRISNDPETPYLFAFDEYNTISLQASVYTPFLVGKDFQVRHLQELKMLTNWDTVERMSGTYTVENTLPFDYEIRPIFLDWMDELPISVAPARIPAGSRESPRVQTVSFDWPVGAKASRVILELKGHTADGRQGEPLYMDQHVTVKDLSLELQFAPKN